MKTKITEADKAFLIRMFGMHERIGMLLAKAEKMQERELRLSLEEDYVYIDSMLNESFEEKFEFVSEKQEGVAAYKPKWLCSDDAVQHDVLPGFFYSEVKNEIF
jgi:hypothetical protein